MLDEQEDGVGHVDPSITLSVDEGKFVLMLIEALVTRGAVKSEELLELGNFRQLILNKLA